MVCACTATAVACKSQIMVAGQHQLLAGHCCPLDLNCQPTPLVNKLEGQHAQQPNNNFHDARLLLHLRTMSMKLSIGAAAGGWPSGTSTSTLSLCLMSAIWSSSSFCTRSDGCQLPRTASGGGPPPPRREEEPRESKWLALGVRVIVRGSSRPQPPPLLPSLSLSKLFRLPWEEDRAPELRLLLFPASPPPPRRCGGTYGMCSVAVQDQSAGRGDRVALQFSCEWAFCSRGQKLVETGVYDTGSTVVLTHWVTLRVKAATAAVAVTDTVATRKGRVNPFYSDRSAFCPNCCCRSFLTKAPPSVLLLLLLLPQQVTSAPCLRPAVNVTSILIQLRVHISCTSSR